MPTKLYMVHSERPSLTHNLPSTLDEFLENRRYKEKRKMITCFILKHYRNNVRFLWVTDLSFLAFLDHVTDLLTVEWNRNERMDMAIIDNLVYDTNVSAIITFDSNVRGGRQIRHVRLFQDSPISQFFQELHFGSRLIYYQIFSGDKRKCVNLRIRCIKNNFYVCEKCFSLPGMHL